MTDKTKRAAERQDAENIVETALRAGEQMARSVVTSPIQDGKAFVVLKNAAGDERLEYLNERFERPARKQGTVKLHDVASFLNYWGRQKDAASAIYGNLQGATFLAVFDDHTVEPAFRGHRAIFTLTHSVEWGTWAKQNNQPFKGNEEFGEWLENQVPDVIDPPGAKLLEIALNMRVQSNASFGNKAKLANGHLEFQYTNAVDGAATLASGEIAIPEQFVIEIPVWSGINATKYRMDVRFRYRLTGGRLSIWYELVRPHKVLEAAFKDVLSAIETGSGTTVLFGSPE